MKKFNISAESELGEVAKSLIGELRKYPVACFSGEMGAGKTTLIKVLCQLMGVVDAMSSPTFSIVNEYLDRAGASVYHFDFYRINDLSEAIDIGADEYFYSGDVCLIEWPEMINALLPDQYLEINIKLVGDNEREITISPNA